MGVGFNVQGFIMVIIDECIKNVFLMDVFFCLMMDCIIFMGVFVNDYVVNVIQVQFFFLEFDDFKCDVQMFINSLGGSVIVGLGIYDIMQYVVLDVNIICIGFVVFMGVVLFIVGEIGKCICFCYSWVMIYQLLGGMQGQVIDMEIFYKLIKDL